MNEAAVKQLLKGSETSFFDRKISSSAFHGDGAANAELVKDICAMANNGNRVSYIVIGQSDDGTRFESVRNVKFTDDNVQNLVRTYITPTPRVRVHDLTITDPQGKRVLLKVVAVGKNARQAFHLKTDLINHKQGYALHHNEVWIRRHATSDLASPAEVARLVKGEDIHDATGEATNVVYDRMRASEKKAAFLSDLEHASDRLSIDDQQEVARLLIADVPLVMRLSAFGDFIYGAKERLLSVILAFWAFEHGMFIITKERPPKHYFDEHLFGPENGYFSVLSRESWGSFCVLDLPGSGRMAIDRLGITATASKKWLKGGPIIRIPVFVISELKDTHTVIRRVRALVDFANSDQIQPLLLECRARTNAALTYVRRHNRAFVAIGVRRSYGGKPAKLPKGEIVNARRFGRDMVVQAIDDPRYLSAANYVLTLSELKLSDSVPPRPVLGEEMLARADHGVRGGPYYLGSTQLENP